MVQVQARMSSTFGILFPFSSIVKPDSRRGSWKSGHYHHRSTSRLSVVDDYRTGYQKCLRRRRRRPARMWLRKRWASLCLHLIFSLMGSKVWQVSWVATPSLWNKSLQYNFLGSFLLFVGLSRWSCGESVCPMSLSMIVVHSLILTCSGVGFGIGVVASVILFRSA